MKFEEQFPSLKKTMEESTKVSEKMTAYQEYQEKLQLIQKNIQKHCLDKEVVRKAIERIIVDCCDCGCAFNKERLKKELRL